MGEPDQKQTDSKLHTIPDTLGAYSSCDAKKDVIGKSEQQAKEEAGASLNEPNMASSAPQPTSSQ